MAPPEENHLKPPLSSDLESQAASAPREILLSIVLESCRRSESIRALAASELQAANSKHGGGGGGGVKRKAADGGSLYQCRRCKVREVDYDAQNEDGHGFWDDDDHPSDADLEDETFIEGSAWTCCGKRGDMEVCTVGEHDVWAKRQAKQPISHGRERNPPTQSRTTSVNNVRYNTIPSNYYQRAKPINRKPKKTMPSQAKKSFYTALADARKMDFNKPSSVGAQG
ncbi:hypothetical protein Q7P37_002772 [Cladosporium fusiforme]